MNIIGLDTETTGIDPKDHRIIELYHSVWDGNSPDNKLSDFDQRFDPERSVQAEASRVHGIMGSDLIGMPKFADMAPALHAEYEAADLLVIHNAEFDLSHLNAEFERCGLAAITTPAFCTMTNGTWATATGKKPQLGELCWAVGIPYDASVAHAAHYDVGVMMSAFFKAHNWGWYDIPVLKSAA